MPGRIQHGNAETSKNATPPRITSRRNSPNIPKLFPKKLPRLVHAFKILLILNFIELDDPNGRCMPSFKPQAPPRTRPIQMNERSARVKMRTGSVLTTQIRRPRSVTQLIRPPSTRQRTPRSRQIRNFRILQRQIIQIITQRSQRMEFCRIVR